MKKIMHMAVIAACLGIVSGPAAAGSWGHAPHHREMQAHYDDINPYRHHRNPGVRDCAEGALRGLAGNDAAAAEGHENTGAWSERYHILREFSACVIRVMKEQPFGN